MHARSVVSTLALVAATFAPLASNAMPLFHRDADTAASATAPKGKQVKLTLKNKTAAEMSLFVNDKPVTIAANGSYDLKTAVGSKVYADDHSTVKLVVTEDLNGNAVSFR